MKNFIQFGKSHHGWIGSGGIMCRIDLFLNLLYSIVSDEHSSTTRRREKFEDVCFTNRDLLERFFKLHQNKYRKQMSI